MTKTTLTAADDWDSILSRASSSRGEEVMLRYKGDEMGVESRVVGAVDVDPPGFDMRDIYVRGDDGSFTVDGGMDRVFSDESCVGKKAEIIFKDE